MFFTLIERNMTRSFVALCAVGGLWAVILAVLAKLAQAWRMSTVTVEDLYRDWFECEQLLSLACIFVVALIALGLVGARLIARIPRAPAVFDLDRELDQIIGLEPVKERIRKLRNKLEYDKKLRRAGVSALSDQESLHMVFQGNPGTGKTRVARLVARLLVEMGVLKGTRTGEPFFEVKRSELIGSAVGKTEKKTSAVIERARGGVLFVDEAYMLTNSGGNDFGLRAVEEIMNHMQDAEGPIFIFAGYPQEMEQFVLTNPGLQRRIGHSFDFADYDVRDLAKIFTREVRSKPNLELGSALSEDLLSCILHDYHPTDRSKFNAALITTRFIPEVDEAKLNRTRESDDARVLGTITLEDVLTVIADHDQRWPRRADHIHQRIVELTKSGSPAAREDAAKALRSLACNDDNKVAIAEAGGIAPLVALARDGTDGQKEAAAAALRRLAFNADNKVAIAAAGGIAPLVALARGGTDGQKKQAADALWRLSNNNANLAAMKDLGYGAMEVVLRRLDGVPQG